MYVSYIYIPYMDPMFFLSGKMILRSFSMFCVERLLFKHHFFGQKFERGSGKQLWTLLDGSHLSSVQLTLLYLLYIAGIILPRYIEILGGGFEYLLFSSLLVEDYHFD